MSHINIIKDASKKFGIQWKCSLCDKELNIDILEKYKTVNSKKVCFECEPEIKN